MNRILRKSVNHRYFLEKNLLGRVFYCKAKTNDQVNESVESATTKMQTTNEIQVSADPSIPQYLKINKFLDEKGKLKISIQDIKSSFDDIPGPVSLRLISKFWNMFPIMGTELTLSVVQYLLSGGKFFGGVLSWGGNAQFFEKFFKVYGPVVRLHGAFGSDVVLLSRPEHASVIFQSEGPYPIRSCLDSIEKYRLECRKYRQPGPFLMSGPDWEKIRKSIEVNLHETFINGNERINDICDEFVGRILAIRNRQEEMPNYFNQDILKWSLECLCSITLDQKIEFLDPNGVTPSSDPGKLLEGLTGATAAISKCEYGFHLWKFFETPAFKSLAKHCDIIDYVLSKYLKEAVNKWRDNKLGSSSNVSLLECLFLKEGYQEEDILTIFLDMFLIGANATAHSVAFSFYHLAKNPRCQIKCYQEIKDAPSKITKDDLSKMTYLKACIKEVLRLNPPIPILSRVLTNDVTVHSYKIPKGAYVLFANHLNGMSEEFFEDAQKFKPERWITNEIGGIGNEYQSFASLPYGYGARHCVAKEMVEIEIAMLLCKIIKHFRIEYNYGDIHSSNEMLATPKKPLKFRFINRLL